MAEYLTPEQRAALEAQLNEGGEISEEQAREAVNEGMRMAQADQEEAGERQLLKENGFEDVQALLDAYGRVSTAVTELREMLNQLLDMEQAAGNAERLTPRLSKRAARWRDEAEMEPARRQTRQAARNRLIQRDWQDSAAQMEDLERLLPEIAEYIMRNPRYAEESDGLRRAYDAVRSARYRDEDALLEDPEFVERMAGNERVRTAVLKAHLEQIMRGGDVPQFIGEGAERGKTPVTGRKPISSMEQAHGRLAALLGGR